MTRLHVGIVGAAGRGGGFLAGLEANEARIQAVCDIQADKLGEAADKLGASEKYTDYEEMIDKSDLDAVVIATPMPLHVPQSILALEHDLHVLSEVPAGVSVEECEALVQACRKSKGIYMMAENYCYFRSNVLVGELIRRGMFGEVYYAEGEYLHELKEHNELTPWRRKWQTGIDGITYGTHSLGPILRWMPDDRITRVCCEGSGHHYKDPRGQEYAQDTSVMLCKMKSGGLVKIRVDMLSNRPHATFNYQCQGTEGCYESARADGERDRIWLRSRCKSANEWLDLSTLEEEFLPDHVKVHLDAAMKTGHLGGDYFEILDFLDTITGKRPTPIGIHEAMDMTLPGLVSQQSAAQDGAWLDVPDSRQW